MALIDRIKFEGPPDVLVWKWHSEKGKSDDIRLGAQLIVNESQEALFLKGGKALDLFGPGTHTLASGNLPLLSKIINWPFGGKTPFAAEVYFINKAVSLAQDWGTKTPVMLLDPRYRVTIPLRGYGAFAVRIADAREFVVQVVGASQGAAVTRPAGSAASAHSIAGAAQGSTVNNAAINLFDSPIVTCIQQGFGDYLVQKKICVLELPAHAMALGEHVATILRRNYKTFGVELVNFTVESINFDPNDPSIQKLRGILDEAARLEVVGDAFRRNQDFYKTDRQFNVLQGAADHPSAAGGMLGAAMGLGMGFGAAGPAGKIAREAMAPVPESPVPCPHCGNQHPPGMKFCDQTGKKVGPEMVACPHCKAENVATARFCIECGRPMQVLKCTACGAALSGSGKFCPNCGHDVTSS